MIGWYIGIFICGVIFGFSISGIFRSEYERDVLAEKLNQIHEIRSLREQLADKDSEITTLQQKLCRRHIEENLKEE